MKKLLLTAVLGLAPVMAQDVVTKNLKGLVETYQGNILESLDKVKEADFDFKPTPDVRSMSEMFGHIADANFNICSQLKAEDNPNVGGAAGKSKGPQAMKAAMAKSFAYCMGAIDAADGKYAEKTNARVPRDKAYAALHLLDHTALHYGNLITYMRLKGMVPPETERAAAAAAKKK